MQQVTPAHLAHGAQSHANPVPDARPCLPLPQVDDFIPTPVRDTDKPFLMPIEDTFSIAGRGTVVTGRIESGYGQAAAAHLPHLVM